MEIIRLSRLSRLLISTKKITLKLDIERNFKSTVVKFEMSSNRKSLALRGTSINLVSLETGSIVEYVFP